MSRRCRGSGGSMNRSVCRVMMGVAGLAVLRVNATLGGAPAGGGVAQGAEGGGGGGGREGGGGEGGGVGGGGGGGPGVRCLGNRGAFPPQSMRQSAGPRTRIEPA